MCGRARCSLAREAVMMAAGVSEADRWRNRERYRPSYNCSPGSWIPVIKVGADGAREVQTMKWGLVPAFTRLRPGERPDHFRMFNARCESLAQKPVFSRLLPGKRCVVLLDGFYEWLSQGGGGGAASRKQPYHITTADAPQQPAMYLAGLYDVYRDAAGGEPIHTFTIITTDSSKPLAWLHDRMPVILTTQEEISAWLGEGKAVSATTAGAAAGAQPQTAKAAAPVKKEEEEEGEGEAAAAATAARDRMRSSPPPPPPPSARDPSTPSSHGRSGGGRRASGAAAAAAGEGSAETKAMGNGAAEAIEVTDVDLGGGGGGGAVSGDQGYSDGYGDEYDDDDDEGDRFSAGRVGSSVEEVKKGAQPTNRRGGGAAAAAVAGKGRSKGKGGAVSEAEKLLWEELVGKICRPYGGPLLQWHPVTPEMSKPSYDKPDCCKVG